MIHNDLLENHVQVRIVLELERLYKSTSSTRIMGYIINYYVPIHIIINYSCARKITVNDERQGCVQDNIFVLKTLNKIVCSS